MPINFGQPVSTDNYLTLLAELLNGRVAQAQWLDDAVAGTLTSTPTGAYRVRSADNGAVQRWNGSSWAAQPINGINYSGGNVALGAASAATYGHGGTNVIAEVRNTGTGLNSQAHFILSSGASAASSSVGSVSWALPTISTAGLGRIAQIAGLTDSTHTSGTPAGRLSFGTKGIGDASAIERLSISSTGAAVFTSAVSALSYAMSATGGAPSTGIAAPASSTLAFYCNTVEVERILPTGRHLFGTTTDAGPFRLQVLSDSGTAWATWKAGAANASYMAFQRGDTAAALGYLGSDGGGAVSGGTGSNLALRAENMLYLAAGGSIRVQLSAAGEAGINCSPPAGVSLRVQQAGNNDIGLETARNSATEMAISSYNRAGTSYGSLSLFASDLLLYSGNANARHKLLSTGHWQPQGTSETLDLGDSTHRYRKLWTKDIDLSGDLSGKGAATTYTPVLTAGANISGTPTVTSAWYFRQNDLVEVYAVVSMAFTAADTSSALDIALPVPSNLAGTHDLVGDCWTLQLSVADNHKVSGYMSAETVNKRATARFSPTATTGHTWIFRFSYKVLP